MKSRFLKDKRFLVSAFLLGALCLLAVLAPFLAPFPYDEVGAGPNLTAPNRTFLMGTDVLGRDLFSRVLFGARVSLAVGFCTAAFALVMGTLTGAIAGFFGGRTDRLIMAMVDIFYIFPMLLLAILLSLLFGRGFFGIFISIGMTTWVTQARLVRALVLQARELPYVEAGRALGLNPFQIVFRHILPNLMGPMVVSLTFQIPNNILTESFLSFVGLGLQPPYASWGTLANEGFRGMLSYPHLMIFPGLALFLTMIGFHFLGDSLRDILDPKSSIGSHAGT
ncbi:MAG: ABC transporter permease [Bdellovibrionales bacterium]|nr:ABC transporter permease [Bdellovibrionales bacterium]